MVATLASSLLPTNWQIERRLSKVATSPHDAKPTKTRDNKRFAAAGNNPPFITHAWNSYVPLIMSDRVPCTCRNRWRIPVGEYR